MTDLTTEQIQSFRSALIENRKILMTAIEGEMSRLKRLS